MDINQNNTEIKNESVNSQTPANNKAVRVDQPKVKKVKEKGRFKKGMKRWSSGLAKETRRITWAKKETIIKDVVITLIICAIMALLFLAIDMAVLQARK